MKNLTPEERAVGKENFDEATGSTRREFLATIGIVGSTARIAAIAATPSISGIIRSSRIRSGRSAIACASASRPFEASPAGSMPGNTRMIVISPWRTTG